MCVRDSLIENFRNPSLTPVILRVDCRQTSVLDSGALPDILYGLYIWIIGHEGVLFFHRFGPIAMPD